MKSKLGFLESDDLAEMPDKRGSSDAQLNHEALLQLKQKWKVLYKEICVECDSLSTVLATEETKRFTTRLAVKDTWLKKESIQFMPKNEQQQIWVNEFVSEVQMRLGQKIESVTGELQACFEKEWLTESQAYMAKPIQLSRTHKIIANPVDSGLGFRLLRITLAVIVGFPLVIVALGGGPWVALILGCICVGLFHLMTVRKNKKLPSLLFCALRSDLTEYCIGYKRVLASDINARILDVGKMRLGSNGRMSGTV